MKAVRVHEHGGPEVLRLEEVADPVPGPGEALVRVRACALNHLDLWVRRGLERVQIPRPHIPGSDVAGEVVAAPSGTVPVGQRVLIQPGLSCGRCPACLSGRDNQCPRYDVLGFQSDGGYAELVKVPVENLVPIPDHVGDVEAAAFPLVFLTAWHMLVTRACLSPGETVLIWAAGSGVGHAAVQLARLLGARVIATVGRPEKAPRARELGADLVLNHTVDDVVEQVRQATDRRGVDVVVEHVGQATWEASVRVLARGGRLVTCGATTGAAVGIDLRVLFARHLALIGSYMGAKGELLQAAALFFAGRLRPVIDRVFDLSEAVAAHERLERREHFGKIVLRVTSG